MVEIGVLVALAACGGPSTDPLVEALEELDLPDDWTRVSEDVDEKGLKGDCNFVAGPSCPRVEWTYEAPGTAGAVYDRAIEAVQDQGYEDSFISECSDPVSTSCSDRLVDGDRAITVIVRQGNDGAQVDVRATYTE